ncbi:MAG: hypothetical protein HOV77_24000 [Hamadaea sp.]|uniref:hypothetical protein n=1 Tax=Hamadaea sp. TaxID=2024425 RepID=UPI001834FB32|nr:hypothetical protein [Hamadaea sp.]NUT22248.1 hypothetical protein [Hamadaea sp.]
MTEPSTPPPPKPPSTPTPAEGSGQARDFKQVAQDIEDGGQTPGAITLTNRMRRTAGAVFTGSVGVQGGGQLAGRDFFNVHIGGEADVTVLPVGSGELAELDHYVEPSALAHSRGVVRAVRVAILKGETGDGRGLTALKLLVDCGVRRVFRVVSFDHLQRLKPDDVTANAGYLLTDVTDAQARSLTGVLLGGVEAMLEAVDARMILTVDAAAVITDTAVLNRTIPLGQRPDAYAVVESRLQALVGVDVARTMLADPDLDQVLRGLLAAGGKGMAYAARLARLCAEERASGAVAAEVRRRAAQQENDDFEGWFDDLPSDDLRYQAVSLASFHGLSYSVVARQSDILRQTASRPEIAGGMTVMTDMQTVQRNIFGDGRSRRLRQLRAAISIGQVPTMHGDVPTEIVSFVDDRYPEALLSRVWHEFDELRGSLLGWLRRAGGDPDATIRIWAAQTVGLLARYDFTEVLHSVILPWAGHDDWARQEAAAFALEGPAAGALRAQVASLVRSWSRPEAGRAFNLTAARAYGASVGRTDPQQALVQLESLIDDDDYEVVVAVARSLADLVDHDSDLAPEVLAALERWVGGRASLAMRRSGQLAFLVVAGETNAPVATEGDVTRGGPLLLALADSDRRHRDAVAMLWRTVFNGNAVHDAARTVWREWAIAVDADPRRCFALGQLAAAIADDPRLASLGDRTARILLVMADSWEATSEQRPPVAPNAARAVRNRLRAGR